MSQKKVAIGIDLGTTKCCVGVVRDGKVEILENERGNKTTPSYVAFTSTERLVGEDAKDQATVNITNTVFGVKGIIGRGLEDDQVQSALTNMPYIIADNAGDLCINVTYKGEKEFLHPQQVTAMILTKMKKLVETRLGCPVQDAVISVPASFSNAQRQATKDAATIAGLKVLALINEPTAAAIAYQANRKEEDKEIIAVVDFGGGKLDVAIVSVSSACVAVNGMSGTMNVGGNAVDQILMMHVLEKFREKFHQDPPNVSVMERLRVACVKLKHSLSLLPKVQVQLDCFGDEFLLPILITKMEYDDMLSNNISSCMRTHFVRALHVSGSLKRNISRVVLVGGSTRIPLVPEEIQSILDGTKLDRSVNPDEAVAQGAAIYAALLSGENTVTELVVKDILPNSFCMGAGNSECVQDLFQASHIPSLQKHRFSEKEMKQKQTFYEVLAGQRDSHKSLGTLSLSQEFARAVCLVENVCFEIDNFGIFDVHVHFKSNDIFRDVLHNNTARLSKGKLQDAVEREKIFRKDDKDEEDRIAALTDLETKCFDLQSVMLTSKGITCFPKLVQEIVQRASETIDWLDTTTAVTRSDCINQMRCLKKLERNLRENINEMERLEEVRATSENNLRLYCSLLEEEVKDDNAREEVVLVAEIGELVKQAKEWLQTNAIPSTADCARRSAVLKEIHIKLKTIVRERLQERARLAAIEDLKCHCANLEKELTTKQDQTLANKWIDIITAVKKRIFTDSGLSKADCEAKKFQLEKVKLEIQKYEKEAEEHERMRAVAGQRLETFCRDIQEKVETCRVIKSDAPPAAQLMAEVIATLTWLQEGKAASLSQCEEKRIIIQRLMSAFDDAVEDEENIIQKREEERKTALSNFQAQHSHMSSFLTEAGEKTHSDLVNTMVQLKNEITEWLETTKTFTSSELERRIEPMMRSRATLLVLNEKYKKQLVVDAQQDANSVRPKSPTDPEGSILNTRYNDGGSRDPERSSKDDEDQNNRMTSDDAQEKKCGEVGSGAKKRGFMQQEGAKRSGADGENHSDAINGTNTTSDLIERYEEQNQQPCEAVIRAAEEEKQKQGNETDLTKEEEKQQQVNETTLAKEEEKQQQGNETNLAKEEEKQKQGNETDLTKTEESGKCDESVEGENGKDGVIG